MMALARCFFSFCLCPGVFSQALRNLLTQLPSLTVYQQLVLIPLTEIQTKTMYRLLVSLEESFVKLLCFHTF